MNVDQVKYQKGLAIRKQLGMHLEPGPNVDNDFFELTAADLFGTVFTRPGLALRDREMITLAVIIAIGGSPENLSNHFRAVRAIGFTDQEIKEIIIQTMYHAGWPRGAASNQVYNRIKSADADAPAKASPVALDPPSRNLAGAADCYEQGLRIREELGLEAHSKPGTVDEDFFALSVAGLFGTVFNRPGLTLRDREMITLAAVIALGGNLESLSEHFRSAQAVGFTDVEIREIIIQTMYYSGWPRGAAANQVYNRMRVARTSG